MGSEANCTLTRGNQSLAGRALLESSELLFRGGDTRVKIPFSSITELRAGNGRLHVRTKDGLFAFHLGATAEKWREKIANPKSLIEKLGVKPGERFTLIGRLPAEFASALKKQGAEPATPDSPLVPPCIFFAADSPEDLVDLKRVARSVQGSTALWVIYPKGQKHITEAGVRSSGLASGLADIKVVSFSPTHTALKFVLPKSKR